MRIGTSGDGAGHLEHSDKLLDSTKFWGVSRIAERLGLLVCEGLYCMDLP